MASVRINISLPKETIQALSDEIESRKRSQFINEAIKQSLKDKKAQKLAIEYKEAASEIRRINRELEGALSDGLD